MKKTVQIEVNVCDGCGCEISQYKSYHICSICGIGYCFDCTCKKTAPIIAREDTTGGNEIYICKEHFKNDANLTIKQRSLIDLIQKVNENEIAFWNGYIMRTKKRHELFRELNKIDNHFVVNDVSYNKHNIQRYETFIEDICNLIKEI
jgi:hypothetical protein